MEVQQRISVGANIRKDELPIRSGGGKVRFPQQTVAYACTQQVLARVQGVRLAEFEAVLVIVERLFRVSTPENEPCTTTVVAVETGSCRSRLRMYCRPDSRTNLGLKMCVSVNCSV